MKNAELKNTFRINCFAFFLPKTRLHRRDWNRDSILSLNVVFVCIIYSSQVGRTKKKVTRQWWLETTVGLVLQHQGESNPLLMFFIQKKLGRPSLTCDMYEIWKGIETTVFKKHTNLVTCMKYEKTTVFKKLLVTSRSSLPHIEKESKPK